MLRHAVPPRFDIATDSLTIAIETMSTCAVNPWC